MDDKVACLSDPLNMGNSRVQRLKKEVLCRWENGSLLNIRNYTITFHDAFGCLPYPFIHAFGAFLVVPFGWRIRSKTLF